MTADDDRPAQPAAPFVQRGTAQVTARDGQYILADAAGDMPDPADTEGLLLAPGLTTGGAVVVTGTYWGPIEVTVEIHDQPPPAPDETWEETAQITQQTISGQVYLAELYAEGPDLPTLETDPDSQYHIRIHANGRDRARDLDDIDEPVERHLIQLWPAD
jgi:hypothetical protein